ncbi:MAG: efflux RND transporter periplasmic adaptor subunit, partial [Gammaproteobacteria bacterium]|nr:efflux RND transporter periplasmic adaptor subunit [Gammaproteobacteria bacterium]
MVEQTAERMQLKRICYVDDSKTSAYVTRRMLEKQGYIVEHFAQAEEALEAVFDRDYDLLITDLMITTAGNGVNGDDLIRLIRFSGHPIKAAMPIIVVTGVADNDVLSGLLKTGANQVLSKPLNDSSLDKAIQDVLQETADISKPGKDVVAEKKPVIEKPVVDKTVVDKIVVERPVVEKHERLSLKDEISAQVEKQEEILIPTLTEEIDLSVDLNPIKNETPPSTSHIDMSFEKRDIRPASSVVNIPLIDDLPIKEKSKDRTQDKKDVADKISREKHRAENLRLKPLDDIVIPSFLDHVDKAASIPVNKAQANDTKPKSNDAWSEIESLFEEESETVEFSDAVELEDELDVSKLDDVLNAALHNGNSISDAVDKIVEEEKSSSQQTKRDVKHTKQEKSAQKKKNIPADNNPLLDLLDQFDKDDKPVKEGERPVFVKPAFNFRFKPNPKLVKIFFGILAFALVVPGLVYVVFQESITEVDFVAVQMAPIHEARMVSGRVVSRKQVDVTSDFPGKIESVKIKEGAFVKKGTVLAVLDGRDARSRVNRAEATLLSTRENVSLAHKSMERLQRALDKGAVSRQMVEDAEANWKTESAKQTLAEEELKEAKLQVERLSIKAPFDGLVASLVAQDGQWLAPPNPLVKLVDTSNLEVELRVDASDSSGLLEGQTVDLSSEAFPGQGWQESITRIASTTERDNRNNYI